MPLLSVVPELVSQASGNLANIGSTLRGTLTAAMTPTTAIAAPAQDEVSAAITALFAGHAGEFQAASAQATAFHDQFVNLLNGGAAQYLNTEVANAQQAAIHAVGPAAADATPDFFTSSSQQYGPVTVATTSTATSSTLDAYIGSPFGNFSLLSANTYFSPTPIGPPDAPFTPFDLHLGFLNNGFGWTASGLPVGANNFEYSFYATNFWDTTQGFYFSGPLSGSGTLAASILEAYGPLGPTGVSFISESGAPYVPWVVFNGSPVFAI